MLHRAQLGVSEMDQEQERRRTLFYKGEAVGYFLGVQMPKPPGAYEYVPYRGPGHHRLGKALELEGPQQCHFELIKGRRFFTVSGRPNNGVLELGKFRLE